jgi:hypothetical protein
LNLPVFGIGSGGKLEAEGLKDGHWKGAGLTLDPARAVVVVVVDGRGKNRRGFGRRGLGSFIEAEVKLLPLAVGVEFTLAWRVDSLQLGRSRFTPASK